ncbi:FAD binding domain in molybdopterin dehydrogenase [Aquisphaera giovannonii]|uniref:FAD binding domain in molybdopterin dehydrogenase n=1 Tax=Aquisphaera giovannonii TaxID=406548 RepID=A0A5B9WEZ2_9BACT|nr:FAD binding domain-containing protein [Aquisphaera giovannonii]QEH39033.1 FAD binding domain in molybdopterin dehydrogenase [Aquisphaera giovannonii]
MDLHTVTDVVRPADRGDIPAWHAEDAWLAGGTWLFSEPQPSVRRLIDLEALRWEPILADGRGLSIAATCTIRRLDAFEAPAGWTAAPLIRRCCRSLLASFKIWNTATVGGNLCMSLPAGALISLTAALEGVCVVWPRDGGERLVPVVDFVTGDHRNVLGPGDLLRRVDLPASALRKRTAFRRMSLTREGRSTALLIGTLGPDDGPWALTVTAATVRPVRIEFDRPPTARRLRDALGETIPDGLYLDDPHGTPAYRKHLTGHFAEQIRRELSEGSRP